MHWDCDLVVAEVIPIGPEEDDLVETGFRKIRLVAHVEAVDLASEAL